MRFMSVPPQPIPSSSNRSRNIAIAVVLALFALIGLGIFSAVRGFQQVRSETEPVAERFLTSIEKHDFAEAYSLLSPGTQKLTTPKKLSDLVALWKKDRGKMTGHGKPTNFFAGLTTAPSMPKLSTENPIKAAKGLSHWF
jgi:hypothetical protein